VKLFTSIADTRIQISSLLMAGPLVHP